MDIVMGATEVDALLVGSRSQGKYDLINAVGAYNGIDYHFQKPERRITLDDKQYDLYIRFLHASDPQDTYRFRQLLFDSKFHYPDGVMLVYDVTNKQSFQRLPQWIDLFQSFKSEKTHQLFPILLIATRADHPKRVINYTEGRKFAASRNLTLIEISTTRPKLQNVECSLVLFVTMIQTEYEARRERQREITNEELISSEEGDSSYPEEEEEEEDDTGSKTDDSGLSG